MLETSPNICDVITSLKAVEVRFDEIVLMECWLCEGGRGYDLEMTDTRHKQNGRVDIYVDKYLVAVTIQIPYRNFHGLSTNFTYGQKKYNMLLFYRTHDRDLDCVLNGIDVYWANTSKDVMCVFLGGININILLKNYTYTDKIP